MGWCVVLEHEMPDGTTHLDWFIDPDDRIDPGDADAHRLLSFRVTHSPVTTSSVVADAIQGEPHRVEYLDYEGAVRGGTLGHVRRLSRLWADVEHDGTRALVVTLRETRGGPVIRKWRGVPENAGKNRDSEQPGGVWRWCRLPLGPAPEI